MLRHRRRPDRRRPSLTVVLGVLLGALLAGVAACSPGGSGAPESEPVTLRVAWWGSDSRAAATRAALDAYTAKHPNVTIVGESGPFDGYFDKLAVQTAARDAPDLVQMQYVHFGDYVDRGALRSLEEYLGNQIDLSAFDPVIEKQGVVDGERYAVPTGANTQAVVYDPAAFTKAGVPVPGPDWTWAEWEATAKALVESGAVPYAANDFTNADWMFDFWLTQRGGTFYTDDGTLGFTAADLTEFWEWGAELRAKGYVPPASMTAERGDLPTFGVATGQGAMDFAYSAQITGLSAASGKELAALPFPTGERPAQYIIGTGLAWAMTSSTQHPEVVADVISFLSNDPAAIAALGMERGVPLTEHGRAIVGEDADLPEQVTLDFTADIIAGQTAPDSVMYNRPPAGTNEITAAFTRLYQDVAFELTTPAAAAEQLVAEANRALEAAR